MCYRPTYLTALDEQLGHTCREVYFTSRCDDLLSHPPDDRGELIGTDMWMGIDQDLRVCPEATEDTQDLLYTPSLLASGVELPIRESSCTTLSIAIVRLRI